MVEFTITKAPLQVCTENTAQGGVLKDKYSMWQSRVLYLSRDMPWSTVFFIYEFR